MTNDIEKKIKAFEKLGDILKQVALPNAVQSIDKNIQKLAVAATNAHHYNGWFTEENVLKTYAAWGKTLTQQKLEEWLKKYDLKDVPAKNIFLLTAGNIPLVGFHDMLCALISGNNLYVKTSANDDKLPRILMEVLISIEPAFIESVVFTDKQPKTIDAVIATGSNNASRYFEYYFGKYPHIIRKNRNSIALLNGSETEEELKLLGNDIFQYFGLGCRNISKIFVPVNYDFDNIFKAIFDFKNVLQNNKYCNNYEYNKTIYLMNGNNLLENGFLLLKEDIGLASPVAVLYYEFYKTEADVIERIQMDSPHIQCVVSKIKSVINAIPFGKTQNPELWDYADGVDTLKFLAKLNA